VILWGILLTLIGNIAIVILWGILLTLIGYVEICNIVLQQYPAPP